MSNVEDKLIEAFTDGIKEEMGPSFRKTMEKSIENSNKSLALLTEIAGEVRAIRILLDKHA